MVSDQTPAVMPSRWTNLVFAVGAAFACLVLASCDNSLEERRAAAARMDPWQMLAALDRVAPADELRMSRFRFLVQSIASAYDEPPMGVADKAVVVQQSLREKGVEEPLLNTLEAMNRTALLRRPADNLAQHAAAYIVLRSAGHNSADAVETINTLSLRLPR